MGHDRFLIVAGAEDLDDELEVRAHVKPGQRADQRTGPRPVGPLQHFDDGRNHVGLAALGELDGYAIALHVVLGTKQLF